MLIHELLPGEEREVSVYAADVYSLEKVKLAPGTRYEMYCDPDQSWVDFFIPVSPNGYWNFLADMMGKRIHNAPTFALCGSYDENEGNLVHFGAGKHLLNADKETILSFFANDVLGYYHNNSGSIRVILRRLQ